VDLKALVPLCGYLSSSTAVVLMVDKAREAGGEVQGSAAASGMIAVEVARMVSSMQMDSSGSHVQNSMASSKVKEIRVNVERCSVIAHRTCERASKKERRISIQRDNNKRHYQGIGLEPADGKVETTRAWALAPHLNLCC
jgi:hypothetical protein